MNKFEKQLEKWNHGVLRGAQARLAKILQVSTATVALWATGKRHPSKGYIAKMGQLFGLGAYETTRLFLAAVPYPLATSGAPPHVLRDADDFNTYSAYNFHTPVSAGRNSISLPVFSVLPPSFPSYREQDVREWWTVPRHTAKGAQFLLRGEDDSTLFFVVPSQNWSFQHVMLAKTQGQAPILCRATKQRGHLSVYQTVRGKRETWKGTPLQPVGFIVLKITDEI